MWAMDHKKRTYSGKLWIAPVKEHTAPVKAHVAKALPMDEEHPDYVQTDGAGGYVPDFWDGQANPDPTEYYTPEDGEVIYDEVHVAASAVHCEVGDKRPKDDPLTESKEP